MDAELLSGIEAGHNMESKVVPEGYGAIFRIVPGIALYASFPGALGLDEIRWTTTYRARILTTKEAFTDVRDDEHPFPSVAKGTRDEWKDTLDFKVTPLLALTLSHEFGSDTAGVQDPRSPLHTRCHGHVGLEEMMGSGLKSGFRYVIMCVFVGGSGKV